MERDKGTNWYEICLGVGKDPSILSLAEEVPTVLCFRLPELSFGILQFWACFFLNYCSIFLKAFLKFYLWREESMCTDANARVEVRGAFGSQFSPSSFTWATEITLDSYACETNDLSSAPSLQTLPIFTFFFLQSLYMYAVYLDHVHCHLLPTALFWSPPSPSPSKPHVPSFVSFL